MIHQLGPSTFFVTFTSAEQNWDPLLSALEQLHNVHQSKIQQE